MTANKNGDMSEFNKKVQSTEGVNEFMPDVSNTLHLYQSYDEYNSKPKPERTTNVVSRLLSVAAILAIVTALMIPSVTVKAEFVSVSCTDTTIAYEIFVEDLSEDSNVSVVIYNDFIRFEESVDGQSFKGEFDGLKPNFRYVIAITDGNKTVAKQTVYTKNAA